MSYGHVISFAEGFFFLPHESFMSFSCMCFYLRVCVCVSVCRKCYPGIRLWHGCGSSSHHWDSVSSPISTDQSATGYHHQTCHQLKWCQANRQCMCLLHMRQPSGRSENVCRSVHYVMLLPSESKAKKLRNLKMKCAVFIILNISKYFFLFQFNLHSQKKVQDCY